MKIDLDTPVEKKKEPIKPKVLVSPGRRWWRLVVLLSFGLLTMAASLLFTQRQPPPPIPIEARPTAQVIPKPVPDPPPPAEAPPIERPLPARPPPPPPLARSARVQVQELASEMPSILRERGLPEAILSAHPSTREPYRSWQRARDRRDVAAFPQAETGLRLVLQDLSNADLLEAQLTRFRARLAQQKSALPQDRLDELERRYLELRSKLKPDLNRDETAAFASEVAALELTLP